MAAAVEDTHNEPHGKRDWALDIFECMKYKDYYGKQRWIPDFLPCSMCCTNVVAGRTYTRLYREKPILCGLGFVGLLGALVTVPLMWYSPLHKVASCTL